MNNRRHLYHARIARHLTLEQIGLRTALSPTVLRHIDEGRFELLPSGVYARAYVRAFAAAVGLDPEAALAEVEELLPGVPDAIAALHEARAVTTWERCGRYLSARAAGLAASSPAWLSRVDPRPAFARAARWPGLIRPEEWLAWPVTTAPWRLPRVPPVPRRVGAAIIDATLLVVVDAFLVMLISWSSGIAVEVLLSDFWWALSAFGAVPIVLYFVLFGGIAGSTLGQSVCHLIGRKADHPLTLPDILRRTVGH